jgi:hypothetical protein
MKTPVFGFQNFTWVGEGSRVSNRMHRALSLPSFSDVGISGTSAESATMFYLFYINNSLGGVIFGFRDPLDREKPYLGVTTQDMCGLLWVTEVADKKCSKK